MEQGSLAAGQCSSTRGLGSRPKCLWQKTCYEERGEEFKAESKSSCQSLSAKMWEVLRRKIRNFKIKRENWLEGMTGSLERSLEESQCGTSPPAGMTLSQSGLLKAKMETRVGADHQKANISQTGPGTVDN